ncbi:helicase associated domain-containing protein [Pseudarthrobacter sp. HLT3-5]|uniref:helicase associated domain-containing protein n=1 Tax=Pseudarthrobacter cellobiosi TaxID=2953654 RepID=UPI00208F29A4|nr:helicase associated domain-containing protein [Pseudarthrobacter sp. HLT3-5]MCO4273829.1 helicase associated domain-containing protein [Pseudarthrobacter sp. HLT3-5]
MPAHRPAPHPEWVQMYRQGLTTTKIAATAGAAQNTVRYHVAIAAAAEPSIRDDHRNATRTPRVTRITPAGLQNLHDTIALYRAECRLPSSSSPSARERALAIWLVRRRQDHDQGTLSRTYSDALQEIPGWEQRTRKDNDEARWDQRLKDLTAYMAAGNDWPRHKRTDTEKERVLGMWLHIQRMKYRRHELDQDKEEQLNTLLPSWRDGRTRGRPPGSTNVQSG